MKRIITLWLAKQLNKLKQRNPLLWIIIAGILWGVNQGLADPQVIAYLQDTLGVDPQHIKWGFMLSTAFAQLYSPHTSELTEEAEIKKRQDKIRKRQEKLNPPTNGQPSQRKKFLGL